jgi:hypothetical protein
MRPTNDWTATMPAASIGLPDGGPDAATPVPRRRTASRAHSWPPDAAVRVVNWHDEYDDAQVSGDDLDQVRRGRAQGGDDT